MPRDGDIDFSGYSLDDLRHARQRMARQEYPINYSRLEAEIAQRGAEPSLECGSNVATRRRSRPELEKLRSLPKRAPVVSALLAINILAFAWVAWRGADPFDQSGLGLVPFGSNYGIHTTGGEWWRFFTSMFLHFGVLHLFLNLWVLMQVGALVERLYGSRSFLFLYCASGVLAAATSTAWNPLLNSAGASGAIFGVLGALLAYCLRLHGRLPRRFARKVLPATAFFIGVGLLSGMATQGIDNAAHLGGLLAGFVFGLALAGQKEAGKGKPIEAMPWWNLIIGMLASAVIAVGALRAASTRWNADLRFERALHWLVSTETRELKVFDELMEKSRAGILSDAESLQVLEQQVLPYWMDARARFRAIPFVRDPARRARQDLLTRNLDHRLGGVVLMIGGIEDGSVEMVTRGAVHFSQVLSDEADGEATDMKPKPGR